MKSYILILFSFLLFSCKAQVEIDYLTKIEIENDLAFLDDILQSKSSYQGLNEYDYRKDFEEFLSTLEDGQITKYDFQLFLTRSIGKIGDRHAYIKGERLDNSLYFPFAFAPHNDKVLVINYNRETKEYDFYEKEFPYLKSINGVAIEDILPEIFPGAILAPRKSYLNRAVRELRDVEALFTKLNLDLPNPVQITLTNDKGTDRELRIDLVTKKERARYWDEGFFRKTYLIRDEDYRDTAVIDRFFKLEKNIGYIELVDMVDKEESPIFFEFLNRFMVRAEQSDALIIDLRDNGGGTRHLIQELAGYIVHPDSIYVVNATRQRGELPLNEELKGELHHRYLFSRDELDEKEQVEVDKFMTSFKPMYDLNGENFSDYYYYVLNGQKITTDKYHYNKPIYILTNERSFSAASIMVSVFKGLPNIKIVGVNTDGSSGNSQRFELPHSELRGKISTMVSYQKDGQILDGIGTKPDIVIERNLDQIFWKQDYQLNSIFDLIHAE